MRGGENLWQREWYALLLRERRLIKKRRQERERAFVASLGQKVPEKLKDTLEAAFLKAFALVFEKGTGVIERTYDKKKHESIHKANKAALYQQENRKHIRAFSKKAGSANAKNLLISGVEGIGLGVLGIGIPDIPLFTGLILKSVYEIALSFGFVYDTEAEQIFILRLIEVSMMQGERFEEGNAGLNRELCRGILPDGKKKDQLQHTAKALADGMLAMKFLQGIPIAGAAGGAADALYLRRITRYAELKYHRRFLLDKMGSLPLGNV